MDKAFGYEPKRYAGSNPVRGSILKGIIYNMFFIYTTYKYTEDAEWIIDEYVAINNNYIESVYPKRKVNPIMLELRMVSGDRYIVSEDEFLKMNNHDIVNF